MGGGLRRQIEEGPWGAGFLFGAQSGISTGEGLGVVSLRKHRKRVPWKGKNLVPGAWLEGQCLGRARGAVEGWGGKGDWGCVSSFLFVLFCFVFVGSSLFSSFGSFLYKGKQAFLKNNKRRGKKNPS